MATPDTMKATRQGSADGEGMQLGQALVAD